jgi:hypothetical protein
MARWLAICPTIIVRSLAVLFVAASACGGLSADDLACLRYAHALCTKWHDCAGGIAFLDFQDGATCEAAYKYQCLYFLHAPGEGETAHDVDACASIISAQACVDYPYALAGGCPLPAGHRANGEGCSASGQCQSHYCSIAHYCGVCADPKPPGAACTATCGDLDTCVGGQCVKLGGTGAACDDMHPCGAFTVCVQNVCQSWVDTAGGACSDNGTTAPPCNIGNRLACSPMNQCTEIQTAGQGEACGEFASGLTLCRDATTCVAQNTGDATGFCMSNIPYGDPCDPDAGPRCEAPSFCVPPYSGATWTCEYHYRDDCRVINQ